MTSPSPYDVLLERLAAVEGIDAIDRSLVEEAMSHRSWCAEHPGHTSNERLEFLGDAVLGWVTADIAFRQFPGMSEGELTGIRKGVVNATALSEVGAELGLGAFIKLGKGEQAAGGATKPSILSDAVESLIGAVYLDLGNAAAYALVEFFVGERITAIADRLDELDQKSTLQEQLAARSWSAPVYDIVGTGPDHNKHFTARVIVDGRSLGSGTGRSKRVAEQAAAGAAIAWLAEHPDRA